jgi:putative acetyltransferase
MIRVREERPEDIVEIKAIRKVNEMAFGQAAEADIVNKLKENCKGLVSLVATQEGEIIGHLLFSPARIEGDKALEGMGLAPLAVLPEFQGQGVGSALVKTGISTLKDMGCPFIIVLGHPGYYRRFGFQKASAWGIRCQWEVPDEAFMILVLDQPAIEGVSGMARYRSEFDEAI